MFTLLLALLLAAAAPSTAHVLRRDDPVCTTDSCLSVVTSDADDSGLGKCNNFLRTTVIPATITSIATTTATTTSTILKTPVSTTVSYTYSTTTTKTSKSTTVTSTTTTATSVIVTTTTTTTSRLQGRAEPSGPTTTSQTKVPNYASPECAAPTDYSSACLCAGATSSTTTVDAPSTTSTSTSLVTTKTTTVSSSTSTVVKGHVGTSTTSTTTTTTATSAFSTTTTTSTTKTLTTSPTPTCTSSANDLRGIQWAYYQYDGEIYPNYPNFDPTVFKTKTPDYNSTWNRIGGFNSVPQPSGQIYNSPPILRGSFFVINHRGYFYASVAGNYKFKFSVDDLLLFWIGSTAYSGWTRGNSNTDINYNDGNTQTSIPLTKGYHPFRMVYYNANGGVYLQASVYDPSGQFVLNYNTQNPTQLVQYSCDPQDIAPPFPDFGAET